MPMSDERIKILQMIAEGKISPEQGDDLLKALEQDQDQEQSREHNGARWLFVRVIEPGNGNVRVNLRLPIGWAGKLLKFANNFAPEHDFAELYETVRAGELGQVVEVDTEDGERVEIWLEA